MLNFSKCKLYAIIIVALFSIYFSIPTFFYHIKELNFFPKQKINFGLDLRGGVALRIHADLTDYINEEFSKNIELLKSQFNDAIDFENWIIQENYFKFSTQSNNMRFNEIIRFLEEHNLSLEKFGNDFIIKYNDEYISKLTSDVLKQSIEIIRKRVDLLGTKEVETQTLGKDMILLQVPGLDNPKEIKKVIGKTARLTFHMVLNNFSSNLTESENIALMVNAKILPVMHGQEVLIVNNQPFMTGDMLESAYVDKGPLGEPVIKFKFTSLGRKIFADITTKNTGKVLAIVFDGEIISYPTISVPILAGEGVISGNMNLKAASELALLLRAGSLSVPLTIIEERLVGPTLGIESIRAGIKACIIAAALVFMVMLLYYKFFGIIANIALIINFMMMISILAIFGATLTLPGIAGIVLTLGMAVDANVLIFERIKEELAKGIMPLNALRNGYKYAFVTIFDSNTTTILASIVIYIFGMGSIKGFAVTLIIGTLCSMFTSILITKAIIIIWYRIKQPKLIKV